MLAIKIDVGDSTTQVRVAEAKKWPSETVASFAVHGEREDIDLFPRPVREVCVRKSQLITNVAELLLPLTISRSCRVRYIQPDDPRFLVEMQGGDLVAGENFCIPTDPPWLVQLTVDYLCEKTRALLSPASHTIKVYFVHRRESDGSRVRRDLQSKAPVFEKVLYTATVAEEQPAGLSVCTVSARDPAGGPLSYAMVSLLDARSQGMFTIDPKSGIVSTLTSLDRELMDVHYFRVTASDKSFPPHSATTTLQVHVQDTNDHAPVFEAESGEYQATVRESVPIGSTVTTVRATDKDMGHNAEVEYAITSINGGGLDEATGTFAIDSHSGVVTTRLQLDRERTQVYTVVITATDQALPTNQRKSSSVTVVVRIQDDNDNYPQFSERTYSVTVPEDTAWSQSPIIATVKATDADEGHNAAIRYAIIGGNTQGQFSIDSQSGEVSLMKPLDYENTRSFRINIRAQDGGSPGKSNTTLLLVNVKDINDNTPRFYTSLFQEAVSENVPVGYSIVRVQAYDADEGQNAELTYSVSGRDWEGGSTNDLPITVDNQTGWIHTTRLLDRETHAKFQFQVLATDGGMPAKTATASVVITVQDVNDNDPVFSPKQYEAVVAEDDPPGTPVTSVTATDTDENPRLHYEITGGNVRGRFTLTTQNGRGLITIAQPLDYKQEKRFILTVRATDSGGRFDTATVYVNVSDANNFSPVFDNAPYTASVFEDAPVGSTVLIVAATDGDVGQNAQITYLLTSSIGENTDFVINAQTGAVTTTKALDRETQSGYLLTVTARDNGNPPLSDSTDVEISVADVNDNAPKFLKPAYSGSVSEDALVGTSVLQISAVDEDTGLNGRVRYALGGSGSVEAFVMDPISGVIRTAKTLDRESIAQYEIEALAIDRGTPQLSGSVLVTIRIEDVNDSPPGFESDKLTLYIAENSPVGSTVGELHAKDPDEGQNAVVQYSIIGGEDSDSFSLVRRPGSDKAELLTMVELDYESSRKRFELIVRAASPPLRSDVHVEILVTDVNDNAPRLKDFQIIFNNFRDCFPAGTFGKIPAVDDDVSDKLLYRILSGNNANLVQLNESSGQLSLSPQLNTNVPKLASMEVSVTDGVNEVKAMMQLSVRLVTDEMLLSSVTVRLADMTEQAFLSPLLGFFIEGLAAIIPCPKENVYVFSIQDDTDVNARILNVSFSARQPDGQFYSPQFLQERVYLNRAVLARIATVQVLPFDDNLCVREPCLNFEHCLTVLKFGNASGFISSDSVLFRPIYPVSTFACRCPTGFTGSREHYLCDTEVNLCYSNPCRNQGKCQRKEGGYTCVCASGFTGLNCEIDLSVDTCQPGICHSGSTCSSLVKGGFVCDDCAPSGTFEHYDRLCQLRGRAFPRESFLTFPALRQRHRLHIALKFATLLETGLLLYNGRYNERHDFIAVEVVEGGKGVQFSFSLGSDVTRVVARSAHGVSDGHWHTVVIDYFNKSATVSLDDCDTTLTISHGEQLGLACANTSTQLLETRCAVLTETCHRFLDLTGPLQIGGLPALPASTTFQVSSKDFVGCIADIHIDHKLLDLNSFVADNGTLIGCPQRQTFCASNPCLNGGTCSDEWATFRCQCPEGWSGKDCSLGIRPAWHFHGDSMLSFNPLLRPIQLPWLTALSVRTLQSTGLLINIQIGQNSSAILSVEEGYLVYQLDGERVTLHSVEVTDGAWHRVEVQWSVAGVTLSLDYGLRSVSRSLGAKLQGLYVGKIVVGGSEDQAEKHTGFTGCIQDVRIGTSHSLLERATVQVRVTDGCGADDPCEDNTCPPHSQCVPHWQTYHCQCHSGFVGPQCVSVCQLNPCLHGASCSQDRAFVKGYSCHCNTSYYSGEYCEEEVDQTCPVSWWGHPVCGPCNCPTHRGYSPDCNKTTGHCSCKVTRTN
ncbi:Cadherin EGF LAG seven-pass G-type receptor 2 [Homalodisca vitripennis]|nr:Cadherin EGF LAG seven-pass G-type receptor 2 [Homalodisca vitripennis]